MNSRDGLLAITGVVALASCGGDARTQGAETRAAASDAETACVAAVETNYGGSGGASVTGSEPSGADSVVTLRSGDGTTWRCISSNGGVVSELSVTA